MTKLWDLFATCTMVFHPIVILVLWSQQEIAINKLFIFQRVLVLSSLCIRIESRNRTSAVTWECIYRYKKRREDTAPPFSTSKTTGSYISLVNERSCLELVISLVSVIVAVSWVSLSLTLSLSLSCLMLSRNHC